MLFKQRVVGERNKFSTLRKKERGLRKFAFEYRRVRPSSYTGSPSPPLVRKTNARRPNMESVLGRDGAIGRECHAWRAALFRLALPFAPFATLSGEDA